MKWSLSEIDGHGTGCQTLIQHPIPHDSQRDDAARTESERTSMEGSGSDWLACAVPETADAHDGYCHRKRIALRGDDRRNIATEALFCGRSTLWCSGTCTRELQKNKALETFDNIKGAMIAVAANTLQDFLGRLFRGSRNRFRKPHKKTAQENRLLTSSEVPKLATRGAAPE
jgi:hypothetical protein